MNESEQLPKFDKTPDFETKDSIKKYPKKSNNCKSCLLLILGFVLLIIIFMYCIEQETKMTITRETENQMNIATINMLEEKLTAQTDEIQFLKQAIRDQTTTIKTLENLLLNRTNSNRY